MDNQTLSNNRFDKKDQLLEINPMALRLSGQSFARGLMSTPCDIAQRSRPEGLHQARGKPRRPSGLYLEYKPEHPNDPDISSLHNFIQNRQPSDLNPTLANLVL
jgi:hypothetical protein